MTDALCQQLFDEALSLHGAGRLAEATVAYRQVLAFRPAAAGVHVNLGIALQGLGRLGEAEAALRHAIAVLPGLAEAHSSLGCVLSGMKRFHEAEVALRRAIALKPADPEAHNNLGNALEASGRWEAAAAEFRRAIALDPLRPQPHSNLGAVLLRLARPQEALAACRAALALRPDNAEAENNLGNALIEAGLLDQAEEAFQRATALRPDFAEAGTNLGALLYDLERFDDAALLLQRCIAGNSGFALAHNNLGNTYLTLGRLEEAEAEFRRALILSPEDPDIHFNCAAVHLKQGRFTEGWREYEWRRRRPGNPLSRKTFPQPEWDGGRLDGRTLLLHAEQGLGDTLQFCRYAALAARLGGRVVLQAQAPLIRLLRSLAGPVEVIGLDDPPPGFDCHLPLMSAPGVLGTELATIPADVPYLRPDSIALGLWEKRLSGLSGLKVGLAWAGDPRPHCKIAHLLDTRRSLRLDQLAGLGQIDGIHLISLQKGSPAAQAQTPPGKMVLLDWMDGMTDMADTAALVAALDLVVTVDTSIAHLAGALGKPVWILSRFDGCWRWLEGRDGSPWYPSARLFRQPRLGDWASVVASVTGELRRQDP